MANNRNLTHRLTTEERRRGQLAGSETKHRNKLMREACRKILVCDEFCDDKGNKITGAEAMVLSVFKKALAGDVKAMIFIRDTVGEKPTDRVEYVEDQEISVVYVFDNDDQNQSTMRENGQNRQDERGRD